MYLAQTDIYFVLVNIHFCRYRALCDIKVTFTLCSIKVRLSNL